MDKIRKEFILGFLFLSIWIFFDSQINMGSLKFFNDLFLLVGIFLLSGDIKKEKILKVVFDEKNKN